MSEIATATPIPKYKASYTIRIKAPHEQELELDSYYDEKSNKTELTPVNSETDQRIYKGKKPLDWYGNIKTVAEIVKAAKLKLTQKEEREFIHTVQAELTELHYGPITYPTKEEKTEEALKYAVASWIEQNWFTDAVSVDGTFKFLVFKRSGGSVLRDEIKLDDGRIIVPLVPEDPRLLKPPRIIFPLAARPKMLELFNRVKAVVRKFWDPGTEFNLELFCIWLFASYRFDLVGVAPYLRLIGPFGSGKTRALDVLAFLTLRPLNVGPGLSSAAVNRLCEQYKPTCCLNEFDSGGKENSDYASMAIQMLNNRFERGHPVLKCNSNDPSIIEMYDPFGSTTFSARNRFSDASLESRCLDVECQETEDESIPAIVNPEQFESELGLLRDELYLALRGFPEDKPDIALGEVPKRFRQLLLAIYQALPSELNGEFAKLVKDLREAQRDKFASSDEGQLWCEIFEEAQRKAAIGEQFALTGEFAGQKIGYREGPGRARAGGKRLRGMGFRDGGRVANIRTWSCPKRLWEKTAIRLGIAPPSYPWEVNQSKLEGGADV